MMRGSKYFFIFLIFFIPQARSGFYKDLKSLVEINQKNYKSQYDEVIKEGNVLQDFTNTKIDQDYLSTLLFYTPKNVLALGGRDNCAFYDLMLSNLIKDDFNHSVENIIVNKDNKKYAISLETFIREVASKSCPSIITFSKYFEKENITKTLQDYILMSPSTKEECYKLHKSFLSDYKSPYLCSINEKIESLESLEFELRNTSTEKYKARTALIERIKEIKFFISKLNPTALVYIGKLCNNTLSQEMFCKEVFQDNFWSKIISGERSAIYASTLCKIPEKNYKNLTKSQTRCILGLANNPSLCEQKKIADALSPILDCKTLSKTLNFSKLRSDYKDCPLTTNNSMITNVGRIINHYIAPMQSNSSSCIAINSMPFIGLLEKEELLSQWGFNLCYDDKIKGERVCLPSIISDDNSNPFAITESVKNILVRTKGMVSSNGCELIDERKFKPVLLKYKSGCFILKNENCDAINCRPKIIFNDLPITHIEIENGINSHYFASKFNEVQYSLSTLIPKYLKLKNKKIFNITSLKAILDKNTGLIHGTGCAEDLLPNHFKRNSFSSCNPINFIIDGYIEEDGYLSVSIRTSLDSLQFPRVISWSVLFSSVKNYQVFQPLEEWSLDGIF